MALDVNERHMLRLGHGQEMLETDKDFSKWGRVNYILSEFFIIIVIYLLYPTLFYLILLYIC